MRVVRKINNNVVMCVDDDGRQVIALGRGLGYRHASGEIEPDEVTRTFYSIDTRYLGLLDELPLEVFTFSAQIADVAQGVLSYELSSNLPFILADHISFAIKRAREGIYVKMPYAYDVEQQYPLEYKLGTFTVNRVYKEFGVRLPRREAVGIAMCLVNNAALPKETSSAESAQRAERIVEEATSVTERVMGIAVDRSSIAFTRYATHLMYLVKRIETGEALDTENSSMYETLRDEFASAAQCADEISTIFSRELGHALTDEEKLYLMLHINRVSVKTGDATADQEATSNRVSPSPEP